MAVQAVPILFVGRAALSPPRISYKRSSHAVGAVIDRQCWHFEFAATEIATCACGRGDSFRHGRRPCQLPQRGSRGAAARGRALNERPYGFCGSFYNDASACKPYCVPLQENGGVFACRETFSPDSSGRFTINLISAHLVKGYKQLAQVFAQAKRLELPEGSLFRHLPTGSDK